MAFTDHCSLYGAVNEGGLNLVVLALMRQRPSLFNYATAFFEKNPDRFCVPIEADRRVIAAGNPLFTEQSPMPVPGAAVDLGLDWCLQLTDAQVDFHPGNVFGLPPELGRLAPQRAALRLRACFGLACPPSHVIEQLLPLMELYATAGDRPDQPLPTPDETLVLTSQEFICVCLEVYAVFHFDLGTIGGGDVTYLKPRLDGLELVQIEEPLESLVECYVRTVLRLGVFPQLSAQLGKLVLDITRMLEENDITIDQQVSLRPTAVSPAVPNNPAIEENELRVFIDLVVEEV
jgi:hypothetical protein